MDGGCERTGRKRLIGEGRRVVCLELHRSVEELQGAIVLDHRELFALRTPAD